MKWRLIGLGLAWLVLVSYIVVRQMMPSLGAVTHGLSGHYTASQLLVQGQFGPQVYDDDWFASQVQRYTGPTVYEILTPNMPTMTLLALPLVWLPPQAARDLWLGLSLLMLLATCGVLIGVGTTLGQTVERSGWLVLLSVMVLLPAIRANLAVGQTYIYIGLLLALALWGIISQRDGVIGITLGLAFSLKTSGLPLWLVLLRYRRWRALLWGGVTLLLAGLLTFPWIGLETWLAYPQAVSEFSRRGSLAVTAYQTIPGLLTHLLVYDPTWNPFPVMHWPALAAGLSLFIRLAIIGLTLWVGHRSEPALLFAGLLPPTLILLPVQEEYHFILLLSGVFVLLIGVTNQRLDMLATWGAWLGLGIALLLLVAPFPFKHVEWDVGWWALLAYPRLFGALLLWVVTIFLMAWSSRLAMQLDEQG